MTDEVIRALVSSGPMAVVLGFAVWTLWKSNRELRIYYEGDPNDPEKKPGRIAQLQAASLAREDMLRSDHVERLRYERDEQKAVMTELLKTLKGD